ncbi:MAG TPA: hypothetical protein VFS02_21855 [Telluria sp.]|nr:hypothetical protein [Telluria sp.]
MQAAPLSNRWYGNETAILTGANVSTMNILDESGHRQVTWEASNAKEIAAAQKTFDRLIRHGYAAFGATARTGPMHALTTFDPTMDDVVMVPRIVGG